ncbi:MAG: hypothetical protein ACFB4J_10520 [Elainellaceae cyanobacterium]
MLPKLIAATALVVTVLAIGGSYSQMSALNLGQDQQPFYRPYWGTQLSGVRYGGAWQPTPLRSSYEGFSGGGPGAGK